MAIVVDKLIPEFDAIATNAVKVSNTSHLGQIVVLFFYPKDNTPGCTAEACDLRDNYHKFESMGYKILGISKDNEKSHKGFIEKFSLPFPLISDTEATILKAYDAWGRKKFMGKEYDGILRKTYIIDENSIILDIIEKVDTKAHSKQILG